MKKKLLSALLSVAMVSTLLVGCGGAAETPAADDAVVDDAAPADDAAAADDTAATGTGKVYYLNFKPEVDEAWQQIAAEYTAATGVEVKVVTAASGTYEEVLRTEIAQENPVTLFQINGPVGYNNWKDYTMDLSNTELYAALSDKGLAVTGEDGGVYGVPYTVE